MSTPRDVAIIIVNYNTKSELGVCLTSLASAPPDCVARIVVVDNASTDGSLDFVRAGWPNVEILHADRNLGFGAGNNLALRQCQEPYALLLNSDTRVPSGAIDTLRDRMIARGAVAAGPRIVNGVGGLEVSFGKMLTPLAELVQRWRHQVSSDRSHWAYRRLVHRMGREQFVDWITGACLLLDVAAARKVGFFDERFFMYEEDVDLCASLRAAGGRILFTPAAEIVHLRITAQYWLHPYNGELSPYDRSHLAFYEKHSPAWAPFLRVWLRMKARRLHRRAQRLR